MLFKSLLISLVFLANLYSEPNVIANREWSGVKAPQSYEDCTLTAQCIFITEAGIIRIAFSITAANCELARNGIMQSIKGFLKSI